MKRMRRKEVILLVLPSAALLGFALLLPRLQTKPKQTLALTSVKVTKLTLSQPNDPDVEVTAQFNYNQLFQERYLHYNWSMTLADSYIMDSKGTKYYMMVTNSYKTQQSIMPSSWSRDFAIHRLWLRYFPKSVGKLTFYFTAIAHDGFKLPVSVVVRN